MPTPKILVINSGSSSIKSALHEQASKPSKGAPHLSELARANIDGIGLPRCKLSFTGATKHMGYPVQIKTYEAGIKLILELLLKNAIIKKLSEITLIGHRVVHGAEKYSSTIKIDAKVIQAIKEAAILAPLHNPPNLACIEATKKQLPKAKQVAVFDTAFHQTMPEKAFLYGLPYELYEKHHIRRYGFHGTSHKYVVGETLKLLKPARTKSKKLISCHLGNGSSITASINGKSIDTSMGFTPIEGPMMGTRPGTFDPTIILHLQEVLKMKSPAIKNMLNHDCGLKGITGNSDMRDVYHKALKGEHKAKLAIDMLAYQTAKICGSYVAAMNGLDALVFTGGLGEKAWYIREKICEYLGFLGLTLDSTKNKNGLNQPEIASKSLPGQKPHLQTLPSGGQAVGHTSTKISSLKSKIPVYVIATDEEKEIAMEALNV